VSELQGIAQLGRILLFHEQAFIMDMRVDWARMKAYWSNCTSSKRGNHNLASDRGVAAVVTGIL
jgi:hypothetical protein